MYRTKEDTQRRKDEKKQMILDVAAKVFSSKGYHNTTVKDIVDEASVSVGSFYFYFKGKEDLFACLYSSIVKEFYIVTNGVLDIENFSMVKNFTRVMTATLWMYQKKREIARIMLLDAVVEPAFQKLESDRLTESAKIMTQWFGRFKSHHDVNIPDERTAALIYSGTYSCFVNDWLTREDGVPLVSYCYGFCVYNLQALGIAFDPDEVRAFIEEVLSQLG